MGNRFKAYTMQTILPWVGLGMEGDGYPKVLSTALTGLSKYQAQLRYGCHHYSLANPIHPPYRQ